MILVDANLLLYAKFSDLPQHGAAARWLEQTVRDGVRIGLPWPSLLAFVRIGTNPRVFARPLTLAAVRWRNPLLAGVGETRGRYHKRRAAR